MVEYKVLITTSGIGSRLGDLTKFTNKSLVRVGKKPAISYIVESYPKEIEMVITVGYFANQVKDFLTLTYPDRRFKFINVDKFEGEGSSL
jgi:NDP-sugar pyrophosphorylase family protein